MSKTQYGVLIVILIIVVAYGAFLYISRPTSQGSEETTNQETEEPSANNEESSPLISNQQQKKTEPVITIEKVERDIKEVLELKDVSGGNAEAEAVLSVQGGKLTLSLRASKLPDPGTGGYAGWLYKDGVSVPVYVGPLSRITSGEFKDSYVLGFQGGSELSVYKIVVVTKEAIVNDQIPEKKVLEGRFK